MQGRHGLYESLITEAVDRELAALGGALEVRRGELRPADAADRIALHLGILARRVIDGLSEKDRVEVGIEIAGALVKRLTEAASDELGLEDVPTKDVLRAILRRLPTGQAKELAEPLIPLLDTTLLTNAPGEPRVGQQINTEVDSADRIDVIIAFIRRSGIRPLLSRLREHCESGLQLRVLTTTYTGTTEAAALDELQDAGAQVRVSYDTGSTRLHAKAWLFHRDSGFSTAYIGSSNLTNWAHFSGLEWNVRVSGARNPDVIEKMTAVFDAYWHGGDFVPYERTEFLERTEVTGAVFSPFRLSPLEVRPYPFQERLLEQIALSRQMGHRRNLLVAATGTGKTVMAALDYARLRDQLPRARLLFVAHRKEILEQSLSTFRHALRDAGFGELWVGRQRPTDFSHVFASIQSLNARSGQALQLLEPDHFDVVIVDEFHHAAASSYVRLLDRVKPRELLGLTATPERADGLPLLERFDNRIAAELRLWDAIDQHRLSPFAYYGISDNVDLRDVPWKRGRGYDVDVLSGLLTANDAYARHVIAQMELRLDDLRRIRALAFCVNVKHARFMARVFQEEGLNATAVWSDSSPESRARALEDLAEGRIQVLFSVDLFNEGVDVPVVDTVLFLRPTDSPTLFLQQLGRGLRRAKDKTCCTVLDFVGQHRREFRMDRRFRSLFGGSRKSLIRQIEGGFPFLPAGCHMELDRVATERVLDNIRHALPTRWTAKVADLRETAAAYADKHPEAQITLAAFLDESGYDLTDVYTSPKSWSDMLQDAGLHTETPGPDEPSFRRACGRLLHIDDPERLTAYRAFVSETGPLSTGGRPEDMAEREQRLLRMLVASLGSSAFGKAMSVQEGLSILAQHPQVRRELGELITALAGSVDHLQPGLYGRPEIPLRVHARYTRVEVLAAFGVGGKARVAPWQTGVYWVDSARADILAFTLDKTQGQFSPTTRYRDYAISRELIHWESQGATREDSETGKRYQHHESMGSDVMLFARLNTSERAFWFLGPATYVGHRGERPMAVTWRLKHPLPGDLYAEFAAAVA